MSYQFALQKALNNIGKRNGHAFPESEFSADGMSNEEASKKIDHEKMLWQYMIAEASKKYFEGEVKQIKADHPDLFTVQPNMMKGTHPLYSGKIVDLVVDIKSPASRVDMSAFEVELQKAGVSSDVIEAAKKKATKQNAPAKTFSVIPRV